MTNKTDYAPITYNCNGATVDFPFNWKILEPESVLITLVNETGEETVLNYGEDYTVDFEDVGGSVKTAIAYPFGNSLIVARSASMYQGKSFSTSTGFQADEIEKAFDNTSINLQDMAYTINDFKVKFTKEVDDKIEDLKDETESTIGQFEAEVNLKIGEINDIANAANLTANEADTKANQALIEAANATTVSNNALNAANNAVEISGIASANATNAVNTANIANTNSANAVTTATTANTKADSATTTANQASAKVDEFGQDMKKVIEAAEKIDELEGAVVEAKVAAAQATVAADNADEAARVAIGALDSKQDKILDLDAIRNNAQTGANLVSQVDTNTQRIEELQTSKLPNATIIGTPHIEGSFVSGFSENNYLQFPFVDISQGLPFEIYFSFTTGSNVTTQQNILDSYFGIALAIQNGKGVMALSSNGSSWDIGLATGTNTLLANTTYYAKMTWTGTQYTTALSTDGETYIPDMVLNSTLSPHKTTIYIGASPNLFGAGTSHPFLGTINFNGAKVIVDGVGVVYEGYADIGFQTRANVSLSNIDEAAKEVIKNISQEELNNPYSLGDSKYSPNELDNVSWLRSNGQWNSGTVYVDFYNAYVGKIGENFGLGKIKSSTENYGDYDLVINTVNETFRLPILDGSEDLVGNRYIDLELGESGSTYTAPANGWFLSRQQYDSGYYDIHVGGINLVETNTSSTQLTFCVPCKKGDTLVYNYGNIATAAPFKVFRFIYAKGNGNLYYYIGETVQNANLIDAGRIEEQLVDKLDRNNKQEIISWGMPDYTAGISITSKPTKDNPFVAPCDGLLLCTINSTTQGNNFSIYINGIEFKGYGGAQSQGYGSVSAHTYILNSGDTYGTNANTWFPSYFFPLKGVIND